MRSSRSWLLAAALALPLLVACDEGEQPTAAGPAVGSSRPAIDLVVRTVGIKKNMSTRPVDGKGEDDAWTAIDGKVYALVKVDMAHNACKEGDQLETSKALLKTPEGEVKPIGGGARDDQLCMQCQPSEKLDCAAAARLSPYTFIFEVDEKSDIAKAELHYGEQKAPLSVAKVTDSRGNDALNQEIEAKKAELDKLKKELENTSNIANGKVIQSEMERIRKEIEALEKKQQ